MGTTALKRPTDYPHGGTSPTRSCIFLMVARNKTLDSTLLGEEHSDSTVNAGPMKRGESAVTVTIKECGVQSGNPCIWRGLAGAVMIGRITLLHNRADQSL